MHVIVFTGIVVFRYDRKDAAVIVLHQTLQLESGKLEQYIPVIVSSEIQTTIGSSVVVSAVRDRNLKLLLSGNIQPWPVKDDLNHMQVTGTTDTKGIDGIPFLLDKDPPPWIAGERTAVGYFRCQYYKNPFFVPETIL